MKKIEGNLIGKENQKYGIIVGRFNSFINEQLLEGCLDGLKRHGIKEENIEVSYVPGAFEMPLVAQNMANKYDGIICLGAEIRGATPHFDYVSSEVSKGIASVSLQTNTPIMFGVLTVDTIEHGIERAGTKAGNKGYDAAISAIEMVNLLDELK